MSEKREKRIRRHTKIRAILSGTKERPRLSVFRSNQHIYAKLTNDQTKEILISVSDKDVKVKGKKSDMAKEVGNMIAKKAVEQKISKVVFDRGGFNFHGRVKAVAEGAREGGLIF